MIKNNTNMHAYMYTHAFTHKYTHTHTHTGLFHSHPASLHSSDSQLLEALKYQVVFSGQNGCSRCAHLGSDSHVHWHRIGHQESKLSQTFIAMEVAQFMMYKKNEVVLGLAFGYQI